jgi:hypothetical protein
MQQQKDLKVATKFSAAFVGRLARNHERTPPVPHQRHIKHTGQQRSIRIAQRGGRQPEHYGC